MAETTMAEMTLAEMVCGRNVLWPNRSVAETSRKPYVQNCLFQPGSHRLNRSISPLDVNIAALRADNLDSTHRWRFITT